ncbi:hypothetical protein [Engelhardtia mirabilis]|uniref:Biotin carboxyl carrier protein of acetyl-CoA carboxylase n=1 Tax=Engelhardtia mirabilis TaxID=2528011 RepID=A0A518BQ67_9BACT|nr:Biotin carboxyl carrier protein of acetyl-CoA carboxylase [Planctomycetes bacterium Pla133]QDV03446.1 Biotin carboxyl carrier protein of acetyl-CoA carboxylase [Planctomycetes bacterium Pla86]
MKLTVEMLARQVEGRVQLLAPGVGLFSDAARPGRILVPGDEAGVLNTLDVPAHLVVPAGVAGRVITELPERVHSPVDYEAVLYELELVGEQLVPEAHADAAALDADGMVVRAHHAGRFWRRPSPDMPFFAEVDTVLTEGDAVGLLEVMKTFNHVLYRATGGLPPRARVTRVLVEDGGEVEDGQALLVVEPA